MDDRQNAMNNNLIASHSEVALCLRMALKQNNPDDERRRWANAFVLAWQESSGIWDVSRHRHEKPGALLDANGNEISLVTWCNIHTGQVIQFLPADDSIADIPKWIKENGVIPPIKVDENHYAVEVNKFYPAPLRFAPD